MVTKQRDVPADLTAPSGLDPFAGDNLDDPYPVYHRLREQSPVMWLEDRELWLLTGYHEVKAALRNPSVFLSGLGTSYERVAVTGLRFPFLDNDAPEHTRVRRAVQHWFSPAGIAPLQAGISAAVTSAFDAALDLGTVDVVEAIARPVPGLVTRDLTGVVDADIGDVARWADSAFRLFGPEPGEEHLLSIVEGMGWLSASGVPSAQPGCLAHTIMQGGDTAELRQEGDERLLTLASIWVAGVDTTTALITTAIASLADNPDQWERLRARPQALDGAVEECLRLEAPIRMILRRTAAPVEIGGVCLPADADVCVLFGAANHDPGHYPDPDRFDIERDATGQASFGGGPHHCLGAPVARAELREVLRQLTERVSTIEFAGPPTHNPSRVIRGFSSLPVRFSRA